SSSSALFTSRASTILTMGDLASLESAETSDAFPLMGVDASSPFFHLRSLVLIFDLAMIPPDPFSNSSSSALLTSRASAITGFFPNSFSSSFHLRSLLLIFDLAIAPPSFSNSSSSALFTSRASATF
ncbi:hypothetical protein PENTCL1PPCAC_22673, partial [Pristionchus entomophagus]